MKYLIGIDGGGTKTHFLLTDLEGKILFENFGSASNFLLLGVEKVSQTILELINECKSKINFDYSDICCVLLGTTGAGRRSDAERLEIAFNEFTKSKNILINNFHVESDARIALEGAFSGKTGSILIAGTGSIMFGKDAAGNIHRVGGFGRFIGDEGSGFSIGRKALTAIAKEFDGRGAKTIITNLFKDKFKIETQENLIIEIYKNNFDIAAAAPLVLKAAEMNDETALRIIKDESDELLSHISTMAEKINEPVLNTAFIGGIIRNENLYSTTLKNKIAESLPSIRIKQPENPPEVGAILMAKEFVKKLK